MESVNKAYSIFNIFKDQVHKSQENSRNLSFKEFKINHVWVNDDFKGARSELKKSSFKRIWVTEQNSSPCNNQLVLTPSEFGRENKFRKDVWFKAILRQFRRYKI